MFKKVSVLVLAIIIGAMGVFAQDAQLRSTVAGQKYKIKGVVVSQDDPNTFVVRDTTGVDTKVVLTPDASVKTNGGFFSSGDRYPVNSIVRGLNLTVEGVGDSTGAVSAN